MQSFWLESPQLKRALKRALWYTYAEMGYGIELHV